MNEESGTAHDQLSVKVIAKLLNKNEGKCLTCLIDSVKTRSN